MGPPDKGAFEVQLVADRISVEEPSGWAPPDREISRLEVEKAHSYLRRPLLHLGTSFLSTLVLESVSTLQMQILRQR